MNCIWRTERTLDGQEGFRCHLCNQFVYAAPGYPKDTKCLAGNPDWSKELADRHPWMKDHPMGDVYYNEEGIDSD